jgi:hypothetical protein
MPCDLTSLMDLKVVNLSVQLFTSWAGVVLAFKILKCWARSRNRFGFVFHVF